MGDQFALESEARISPLVNEKKRLFNDLLIAKGNIKLFCRTRPLFEDEGPSVVEFPDQCTIRINTGDETIANPKKDFEFDRVYGPHVGKAELFSDVQPFVQSALDGYNVSIFAYGQTRSGKTHTMEGSNHDRGLYARCFEELFDLANSDLTSSSKFNFSVTAFDLYNEQIRDLLSESGSTLPKILLKLPESSPELVQEKVENPMDFSKVLKAAFQSRQSDTSKFIVSLLTITVHIYYNNLISGENSYNKLSLIDLSGSDGQILEEDSGERVTDLLHVMKSLSALGDVLSSLTSKKDNIPYENSMLTNILADSLGGNSKSIMIVNICQNAANLSETLSSLNFAARARNSVLSLGNRDTIKKWRDVILQQMRIDAALLTLANGSSPIQNPSTAAEDARLASLISLDGILKQVKDITRQSSVSSMGRSKKKAMLASLDELGERMPSLLDIDHPCARRQIASARRLVESIHEEDDQAQEINHAHKPSTELGSGTETDVAQWNVLQFNTGSTTPFVIKCGANSNSELVIKADAKVQEPKGGEIVRVVPRPVLENMSLDEMKQVFSELPEALSLLALARTADGTRARYSRLYRTLAMKVPSLRDLVGELEKAGVLKDVKS